MLVGGFNPSEKNISHIGSFRLIGMKISKIYETTNQHQPAWLFPCPFDLSKQQTNMPIHLPLTQLGLSWCDPAVAREVISFPVMPGDTS